jgi:hypothetical protein
MPRKFHHQVRGRIVIRRFGQMADYAEPAISARTLLRPTGSARMPPMPDLPVVPKCRTHLTCAVGQITTMLSPIPAR